MRRRRRELGARLRAHDHEFGLPAAGASCRGCTGVAALYRWNGTSWSPLPNPRTDNFGFFSVWASSTTGIALSSSSPSARSRSAARTPPVFQGPAPSRGRFCVANS